MTEVPKKKADQNERPTIPRDELANTITHGLGFFLSLFAAYFFWNATTLQSVGLRLWCIVFAASMALVYLSSTLSHVLMEPKWRGRMRAWDQGTIYLMIAGTYSPFVWEGSPPSWSAIILAMIWAAALWGFYAKVCAYYNIDTSSTVTYVMLGWLPAMTLIPRTPWICFAWLFIGGLSYTLGILFLIRTHKSWFAHSLWHVMVILGSFCHCIAINELLKSVQVA